MVIERSGLVALAFAALTVPALADPAPTLTIQGAPFQATIGGQPFNCQREAYIGAATEADLQSLLGNLVLSSVRAVPGIYFGDLGSDWRSITVCDPAKAASSVTVHPQVGEKKTRIMRRY